MNKFLTAIVIIAFTNCSSDKKQGVFISDQTILNLISNSSFTYFKNNPDTLTKASLSPHGQFVRVKFNASATTVMDDSVKRLSAESFPDESLIVKEVYS